MIWPRRGVTPATREAPFRSYVGGIVRRGDPMRQTRCKRSETCGVGCEHLRDYPYAFHIALDGSGLNGLEGRAGVCLFKYDVRTNDHAYKVTYFDGIAGGHAPNVNPARTLGFLGNTGQHLLFYDATTLDEAERVSTLRFEIPDTTIKGSTHLIWLDDAEFVTAIGEQFWKFDVNRLTKAEPIGSHQLKIPHAMKRTASGRYVVYGGMDHPGSGEAREVGILDLVTGVARRVALPTTCWHVVCHPSWMCSTLSRSGCCPAADGTGGSGEWPICASTPTRSAPRTAKYCDTGPPVVMCRRTSTPM
jgi:hypothetical protein